MTQTIYGDVLFLINFCMDFLSLYIAARIMHMRIKTLRFVLSSALGGIYGVISLFIVSTALSASLTLFVPVLMCIIAYGKAPPMPLIKSILVFFASSALLGGLMTVLFRLFGSIDGGGIYIDGEMREVSGDIPLRLFIPVAAVAAVIALLTGRFFKKKSGSESVKASIEMFGREITVTALCDTGSFLSEPLSGKSVLLVSYRALRPILPPRLRRFFEGGGDASALDPSLARLIRAVPIKSAGGEGIIFAIKPDRVTIGAKERDCMIGVDTKNTVFSGNDAVCPSVLVS